MKYDFSGWATKANLKCSDGAIIMRDAFKHNDGQTVPLVFNHTHDKLAEVIGHAELENREEGVYAYGYLNDTPNGKIAKMLIEHGDVNALSIYARNLKRNAETVIHGDIKEVSLVLAGANPGAFIDTIIAHSDGSGEEGLIYTGEFLDGVDVVEHADPEEKPKEEVKTDDKKEDNKSVKSVIETMNEEQKTVLYSLVGQALAEDTKEEPKKENASKEEPKKDDKKEGGKNTMNHNVFDQNEEGTSAVLSHSDMEKIMKDGKRYGSLKDAVIANGYTEVNTLKHSLTDANGNEVEYGISNIDYLFPDARNLTNQPIKIKDDTSWVAKVMNGAKHSPFSRIKTTFADMTAEDLRARGYVKGNLKLEDVFGLMKRTTTPTTVYKKRKLDKDDVNDITDFDVVSWIKSDMREFLDAEIARAALLGDGRSVASDDKINEQNIRPILSDAELFVINKDVEVSNGATTSAKAEAAMEAAVRARKDYKGSGSLTFFTTIDFLNDCLFIKDLNGRCIYESEAEVAKKLRVKEIVTVPAMENITSATGNKPLIGIMVDMSDYNFGADKGGAVNMFDDFDIDFNQMKYLIETRCSGALVQPYSAIVLWLDEAAS